jgi:light-regulated signal transduction histidine kinase (bacteriophytochrome)
MTILEKEQISSKSKQEIKVLFEQALKAKELDDFLIERLRKNEKITQRFLKVTISELEEKNKELSKYIESNLQLENFAHIASHDLKAPLINIIAFSRLLTKNLDYLKGSTEYKFLESIELSAQHMQDTIKGLFNFSRATNAKIKVKQFDIKQLIDELCTDLAEVFRMNQVNIFVENLPEKIYADRILIKELLLNLILNSIKFQKKEAQIEIKISAVTRDEEWEFIISDNGIGIAKEFKEKIFILFKRLHNAQKYSGTGIGLALCKSIVENHGGKIRVESELGTGSSFYFTIKK